MSSETRETQGFEKRIRNLWIGFKAEWIVGSQDIEDLLRAKLVMEDALKSSGGSFEVWTQYQRNEKSKLVTVPLVFDAGNPVSRERLEFLLKRTQNAIANSQQTPNAVSEMKRFLDTYTENFDSPTSTDELIADNKERPKP